MSSASSNGPVASSAAATERHVAPDADRRIERQVRSRRWVERAGDPTLEEPATSLERGLRLGRQGEGGDASGDGNGIGVGGERPAQRAQPRRLDDDIVVGEHDDVTAAGRDGAVAGDVQPGHRLAHHVDAERPCHVRRSVVVGRVVDDEHRRVDLGAGHDDGVQDRPQAAGEQLGTVARAHGDRDRRRAPQRARAGARPYASPSRRRPRRPRRAPVGTNTEPTGTPASRAITNAGPLTASGVRSAPGPTSTSSTRSADTIPRSVPDRGGRHDLVT